MARPALTLLLWVALAPGAPTLGTAVLALALAVGLPVGAVTPSPTEAEPPRLEPLQRLAYPEGLSRPLDVRWAAEGVLLLLDAEKGALRVSADLDGPPEVLIPGRLPGQSFGVWRLGTSKSHLAVSAFMNTLVWRDLEGGDLEGPHFYAGVVDMDLHGDRIAILGTYRDREGAWMPDGGIVRWGGLADLPYDLESLLISVDGPRAPNMSRCDVLPLGGLRFLDDGSLLVAPGVQPGILLISAEGETQRVWDSGEIGIVSSCDMSQEESDRLARDPEARWGWLSQRSTVDGIIPLGKDGGLIVRRPGPDGVRWDLVVLRRDGSFETLALPVESPSLTAHLRGDSRGDRIVLALSELTWPGRDRVQEPELIYLRWRDPR
jgi:hypothetical protein